MTNRRGGKSSMGNMWWFFGILVAIIVIILIYAKSSDTFSVWPYEAFHQNLQSGFIGFENSAVFGNSAFKFLNYIFGSIPNYLINTLGEGSEISSAIVIVAIWVMFFLIFADIMRVFSPFRAEISWIVAGLLAIICANLRFISVISVYMLTIMAAFGSLAVLFALGSVFVFFLLFHFGSENVRTWLMMRRAQDHAMRIAAGGEGIAGTIEGLEKIGESLKKAKL